MTDVDALFRYEEVGEKERLEEEFSKKLDALYNSDGDSLDDTETRAMRLKAILDLFRQWEKDARARHPDEWAQYEVNRAEARDKGQLGIYKYNLMKKDNVSRQILEKMEAVGFSANEEYFEIHLPASYESEEKLTPENIKKYTAKLAELIVDEYPQARGVVGTSWLLDRAALRRFYGFKVVAECKPNWSQFIGEDGQVNAERVEELIQTGELPHKNIFAVVDIVDFLKKFLPQERRGQIKLKEVDPVWLEKYGSLQKETEEEGRKFSVAWDDGAIKTAADVRGLFDALPKFKAVMSAVGVYDQMVDILIANIGKSRRALYMGNKGFIEGFTKKTDEFYRELEKTKFREKIVTIE
jgi:hypothetical protein